MKSINMKLTKKNKIVVSLTIGAVAVFLAVVLVYSQFKPAKSTQEETIRFVVPKGQAVSVIGQRLAEAGLIKNALIFRIAVRLNNLEQKIQAGSFDLSASSSVIEIAQQLTMGTQDVWITILEGWRMEEIAESLDSQDLDAFDKEEFIALAQESEGMLFPDTYLIPREMSTENIHSMLINTFERKIVQGLAEEISQSDRDFEDVLIMASLVEREARNYEQMRKVAGILWNRIDLGMALQVDATLQYAAGYNNLQKTWWAPPTADQKQLNSLFNTYLHPGLPPKPIANPSYDAIKATLLPLKSSDFYYIHADDGNIYTAATLEQHNANINKYLR
ncbi:MAG: aminodeoxychorismate lyase [Patescibacteria group bacterium]|nr:MAG: aminodeoxychorismate lyase [Patescibacteria group bacterium]